VAGLICLLFGSRALWRVRAGVLFLFLAWPLPWQAVLTQFLATTAHLTLSALTPLALHSHLAATVGGGDGSLFLVGHGVSAFEVSVASPCSGANGAVGFLLAGGAFCALSTGRFLAKMAWMAVGVTVAWVLNVVRLLAMFVVGSHFGARVALVGLHPFLGALLLGLGVVAMALVAPRFGVRVEIFGTGPRPRGRSPRPWLTDAVPNITRALALLAVVAVVLATADARLAKFNLLATDLGVPRFTSFSSSPLVPPGWRMTGTQDFPWVTPYFGSGSTWTRFEYSGNRASPWPTLTIDDVQAPSLFALDSYSVQACYGFHGYASGSVANPSLGGGVVGVAFVTHQSGQFGNWDVLSWTWPVKTKGSVGYERITVTGLAASSRAAQDQASMVSVARGLVTAFAHRRVGTTGSGAVAARSGGSEGGSTAPVTPHPHLP